jgi:hypothetical protein
MAAEYPSEEQMKKMAQDQMRMRSTNSTIAQGPLSAMTAAQKAANPVQVKVPNMALPKSMAINRSPEELMAIDRANETSSAMAGLNYNETPAAPVRDRTTYVPSGKQQSMNMRSSPPRQPTGPREYSSFGEFLKTMGLGK